MRRTTVLVFFLLLAAIAASSCKLGALANDQPTAQPAPAAPVVVDGMRTSYADVVDRTSIAVVRIEAEHKEKAPQGNMQLPFGDDFFKQFPQQQQPQRPQVQRGAGSGVIVKADGTILTNNHVVSGAEKITVLMSDNKSFDAKIVGTDEPSDLAVIKIEGENLPFSNLGDSDQVRVGDIVLAIGNPLGIGQTVTAGIISAKGRRTGLSDGSFEDFLQTDAPINRGNSGGALVNLNSELIGINSQILSPGGAQGGNIGIGFSIPSNMAKSVLEQLVTDGKVRRGMLGINIQNISDEIAQSLDLKERSGVLVSNVKAGSAAEKAGLKRNDVIVAINGEKIEDSNVLRNKVAGTKPGTQIKISILREGAASEVTATLDEFEIAGTKIDGQTPGGSNDSQKDQGGKLGLGLQPVTPQLSKQLGLDSTEGLAVTEVDPNGPAAAAGIQRGDVVLEINRKAVASVEDVRAAIDAGAGRPILLLVPRRGQTVYVPVKPT
ncbi:MAG TPA: Do family serine endopeptidase [Pyrinomonadaceae bacterium]|nr:Do family serine endopeptidase [Pyrinomonadaceae bacterium]